MDWKSIIKEKCQKVQRNNVRNQKNAYWFEKRYNRYSLRLHHNHSATLNALKNMKIIRSIYLYFNKNKYDIFSFSMFKFNDDQKRYISIARTTLQKYNENYGLQIGLSLHRAFGKDLALYIYDYI